MLFLPINASYAGSNELLKMDVDQTSDNSIKLNIYTDKPYNEQIIVNKKPDNKYVILLPETTNSMKNQPDISDISSLKNIDVKTQQYSSLPGKGYTKITIDSKKPIEVIPQAHVTHQMPNMKKTAKKPYLSSQQVQMSVPKRILNQQKPVTSEDFSNSEKQTTSQVRSSNYYTAPTRTTQYSGYNYTPAQNTAQSSREAERQSSRNTLTTFSQQQTSQVREISDNSALTQNEQVALEDNQAIDDVNNTQSVDNDDDISEADLAFFKKIIKFKQKVAKKIKQILSIRVSFMSIMTVLQFILLIVLVKIIKDLVQKIQYPTEQQSVSRRLIHDNDETFEQSYPSYSNMDVYNATRSNFEEDRKEGFNVQPLSASMGYKQQKRQNNLFSTNTQPKTRLQGYSNSNDFYKPINEINEEDKMSIFDENAKDIEKTIFRNPLTQLSQQAEEHLFDDNEIVEENSPFSNQNSYSNRNENFFRYDNINNDNQDFFIFDNEDDDYEENYQEDYSDVDDDEYDYDYSDDDVVSETDDNYNEEDYYDETDDDNDAPQEANEPKKDSNPFEHLTVKSKYVIDSNRGFAQVNVDGINALIGYVGSKISVIRKFNEDVQVNMQVRMNEQPDAETMIYIIKVGNYKTLVEVKQDSIRQLLDL